MKFVNSIGYLDQFEHNVNAGTDYRSLVGYAGVYSCHTRLVRQRSPANATLTNSNSEQCSFLSSYSSSSYDPTTARPLHSTRSFPVAAVPGYTAELKLIPIGAELFRRHRSEPPTEVATTVQRRQRTASHSYFGDLLASQSDLLLEEDPLEISSFDYGSDSEEELYVPNRLRDSYGLPIGREPRVPSLLEELSELEQALKERRQLEQKQPELARAPLMLFENLFVNQQLSNRRAALSRRSPDLRHQIADLLDGRSDWKKPMDLESDLVLPEHRPNELVPLCGVERIIPGVARSPVTLSDTLHDDNDISITVHPMASVEVDFLPVGLSEDVEPNCSNIKLVPMAGGWLAECRARQQRAARCRMRNNSGKSVQFREVPPLCGRHEVTAKRPQSVPISPKSDFDSRRQLLGRCGELAPLAGGGGKFISGIRFEPTLAEQQRFEKPAQKHLVYMLLPDVRFSDLPDLMAQLEPREESDGLRSSPVRARLNVQSYLNSIAPLGDSTVGSGKKVLTQTTTINELEIALFRICDLVVATSARCPHAGGPLAMGSVEALYNGDCVVRCPWHGFTFNLFRNGEVHEPRTRRDLQLPVYPVKVEPDGALRLGFSSLAALWFQEKAARQLDF